MIFSQKKYGVISLGCDKNRVDTEKMLYKLGTENITQDMGDAEIIIVNTCAFLESARKEAIDTVLECNEYREKGKLEKIVMTGCLSQKFIDELYDEFKEVDVFLGIADYDLLPDAIERAYKGERVNFVGKKGDFKVNSRVVTTPLHYAYLKIADGCNNHCTYCLIPFIRGKYRSEREEDLIEEAKNLGEKEELILVAQDVTRYGEDLYGKPRLAELLQKLSELENIKSIRLLYCYPDMITDELIAEIKSNEKIIKYLDIPLQHADDEILKRMNRKGRREDYEKLINKLRSEIPEISIRSTFIAGFPTESEENFNNLLDFIEKTKLNNAGFFAYSKEEGTPAYKMKGHLPEKVKEKRVKILYETQMKISAERNNGYIGKTIEVLTDGVDYDKQSFYGRAYFSAPEIDGKVYFKSDGDIEQGKRYNVKITSADEYDLYGEIV